MPQQKAAIKAMRVSGKKNLRNQRIINEIRTINRKFSDYLIAKDPGNAKTTATSLIRKINIAKSKGALHATAASRKISRIMKKITALT